MSISSFDWTSYEDKEPSPKKQDKSFDWAKYEKEDPSRLRSLVSAPIKGLIKGSQGLNPFGAPRAVSEEMGERLLEQFLPTQKNTTENLLERAGKLAPIVAVGPEGVLAKGAQLGASTLAGEIARQNDVGPVGQAVAEALAIGLPGLAKGISSATARVINPQTQKFSSGLTKPLAVESKHASKGIINPERQKNVIRSLNEEASKISKGIVSEELPVIKKIEDGFDFQSHFEKEFGGLRKSASKHNPTIDVTPVSELLSKSAQKYKGIPTLHPEAKKIVTEITNLRNRPQTQLSNLLKIYRSNHQKLKNIYETSRISGKQQEYADFLVDLNKAIGKSFERTLPEDSFWLKKFKSLNSEYRDYKNGLKTLSTLEPILKQRATPAALEKLANDKVMLAKLKLQLGEKAATEISQLSKDLQEAVKAVRKIPAKEYKAWDAVIPLSLFIPNLHGLTGVLAGKKALDFSRRFYGYILSKPGRMAEYKKILEAIKNHDKSAYVKLSRRLLHGADLENSDNS